MSVAAPSGKLNGLQDSIICNTHIIYYTISMFAQAVFYSIFSTFHIIAGASILCILYTLLCWLLNHAIKWSFRFSFVGKKYIFVEEAVFLLRLLTTHTHTDTHTAPSSIPQLSVSSLQWLSLTSLAVPRQQFWFLYGPTLLCSLDPC